MKNVCLIIGFIGTFLMSYAQDEFTFRNKDYEINLSILKKNHMLFIEFEIQNKNDKLLLISKEQPCTITDWFVGKQFIRFEFGPDLVAMREGSFIIEEIKTGEKRKYKKTTTLPRGNKFTLCLVNNLYWYDPDIDRSKFKYNTDYCPPFDCSLYYIPIKL